MIDVFGQLATSFYMYTIVPCNIALSLLDFTYLLCEQTIPPHVIGQLDKCLREASTLDGVLEFRHEHFWTVRSLSTLS